MTSPIQPNEPGELRCLKCGKLLAKNALDDASLKIKCLRCGEFNPISRAAVEQVIITDADGVILYANDLVERVTGYRLDEVLGRRPSLWGGQMSRLFYQKMWRTIKDGEKPLLVKLKNRRKDGTFYQALLHISPVFGTDKKIKLFVGLETIIKTNQTKENENRPHSPERTRPSVRRSRLKNSRHGHGRTF